MSEVAFADSTLSPVGVSSSLETTQPSAGVFCPFCGALFYPIRSNKRFCSQKCQQTANNRNNGKANCKKYRDNLKADENKISLVNKLRRDHYRKTKDKQKIARDLWRLKNKSKLKEYNARWRVKKGKLWAKHNYEKRKSEISQWRKQDRKLHPGKYRKIDGAKYALRKSRIHFNPREQEKISMWESEWKKRKSVKCFWCLRDFNPNDCHKDHILALASGGPHKLENLCISCGSCNCKKQDKPLSDWNSALIQPVLI